jgi:hypothetical protein
VVHVAFVVMPEEAFVARERCSTIRPPEPSSHEARAALC